MTTAQQTRPVPLTRQWLVWPLAGLRSAGMRADRIRALADDAPPSALSGTESFAADPWFLEAVTWQNLDMVNNWLARYAERLAAGDRTLHRRAYREVLIARYAQRYTTKNDTIGFFGPVGWAALAPDDPCHVRIQGDGRELRRGSYFETWALQELAVRWSADAELRAHLPPWRDPSARLDGDRLFRPRRSAVCLSPDQAAVLALCDGRTRPAGILDALKDQYPELEFVHLSEVLSVLGGLAARGCVTWGLRLPVDDRAERHLYEQLAAVPDVTVRERCLEPLDELLRLREAVDKAAGDPPALREALNAISEAYSAMTSAPPNRTKRERGAGRSLLWLDTLEDWDVTVGRAALDELAVPLGLMADVCRWLTWRVARGVAAAAERRLAEAGDRSVRFAVLVAELAPELAGAPGGVLDTVVRELHATVAALLGPLPDGVPLRVPAEEIAARWAKAFEAPGPGWEGARMHSPDLMLSAPAGDDTGRADDRVWVLNEIHVAVNTLDNRFFVSHQARPGVIEELVRRSTYGTRYVPAVARTWPGVTSRTYPPLTVEVPGAFVHWALEPDDVMPTATERVPTAGLQVLPGADGEGPVVTDGAELRAPFTEFAGELLSFLVGNAFQLFPRLPYVPRVQLGALVVQRETWHLSVDEVLTGVRQVTDARRLADNLRDVGVPRHLYAQLPGDSKPFFCDLGSDLLTRNLLRQLRASAGEDATFRVQEMLPDFDHLWLTDAQGGGRTSEFRTVIVDDRILGGR
jgi:hypothetical protein